MQQKRKKVTRKRGTETHGHGASKKRRGAGHRGGRGNSGAGKRGDFKIAKVAKYNNKHHGKYGFTSKNRKDIKAINIHQIQIHIHYFRINSTTIPIHLHVHMNKPYLLHLYHI